MLLRTISILLVLASATAFAGGPFLIEVVEKGTNWPVPLVELRTTGNVRFVTDNAGRIAFDLPEAMGRETWFHIHGNGYSVPKDGFGYRGVRLTPRPGKSARIEVTRDIIAKRLGRLTGGGLFSESQKLGLEMKWKESGVLGCDSVQNAHHKGKLYWLWGDTNLPHYPLGIFHMSAATTKPKPLTKFEPPLRVGFDYFTNDKSRPRGVAKMPGKGPTWLNGFVSVPDKTGTSRLVATYRKIEPPLEVYRIGLCVWNEKTKVFEDHRVLWNKADGKPIAVTPYGHPVKWTDKAGKRWLLFGDPLPKLRCPATFEAWQDPTTWEKLTPQKTIPDSDGKPIRPHTGSIAWHPWRKRWVTVFMQAFGKPSAFGELWYAEADAPTGPWGPAVKVLTHENYTFYNPRLHVEMTPTDSPMLLFEGTYTTMFANHAVATPRYEYNQILYRLDLDDPALSAARKTISPKEED